MLEFALDGLLQRGGQLNVANQHVVELDVVLCELHRELVLDLQLDLLALGGVELFREVFRNDFPGDGTHGWADDLFLVVAAALDFQPSQVFVLRLGEHGHVHVDLEKVGAQHLKGFHLLGLANLVFVDLVPRRLEVKATFQGSFIGVDPFSKRVEGQARMSRRNSHGQRAPQHDHGEEYNKGKEDAAQASTVLGRSRHVHAAKITLKQETRRRIDVSSHGVSGLHLPCEWPTRPSAGSAG